MNNQEIAKGMLPWVKLMAGGRDLEFYCELADRWQKMADAGSIFFYVKGKYEIRVKDNSEKIDKIKAEIKELTDQLNDLVIEQAKNSPNKAREGV